MCIHIFPLVTTEHWVEFPVLYSRFSLLSILYIVVYICQSQSPNSSHSSFLPLVSLHLFSPSVCGPVPIIISSFFFFNILFIYLFLYLFLAVLGLRFCARASSSRGKREPLFIAVRGPLHHRGLSCCGAQAPDAQAQQLWLTGLVTPRHVGSSQTRARTHVPCISRQTVNHCATREALLFFLMLTSSQFPQ